VQSRHCDGNTQTPLTQSDPITCRRFDIGRHQATDAFLVSDGTAIKSMTFPPFRHWDASIGDGGDHAVVEGRVTRADSTQDGGYMGVVQYWVGPRCGGDGWVLFRDDAGPRVVEGLTRLGRSFGDPNQCDARSNSWTRYWTQDIDYPQLGTVATIVSEHFNNRSVARSTALERFFFGKGWGRLVWQAWSTERRPEPEWNVPARCPLVGDVGAPGRNWVLYDCRTSTLVEPADGSLTGNDLWFPRPTPPGRAAPDVRSREPQEGAFAVPEGS